MSGLGHRGFESRRAGDRVLRHEPAVAPAADAETVWVGDLLRDQIIETVHQILKRHSTPVVDRGVHCSTLARHAASVRQKHNVTMRSQQLSPVPPPARVKPGPPRRIAWMSVNDGRVKIPALVIRRRNQNSTTRQTVL